MSLSVPKGKRFGVRQRFDVAQTTETCAAGALRGLIAVYQKRGDAPALTAARKRSETTWLGEPGGPSLTRL